MFCFISRFGFCLFFFVQSLMDKLLKNFGMFLLYFFYVLFIEVNNLFTIDIYIYPINISSIYIISHTQSKNDVYYYYIFNVFSFSLRITLLSDWLLYGMMCVHYYYFYSFLFHSFISSHPVIQSFRVWTYKSSFWHYLLFIREIDWEWSLKFLVKTKKTCFFVF